MCSDGRCLIRTHLSPTVATLVRLQVHGVGGDSPLQVLREVDHPVPTAGHSLQLDQPGVCTYIYACLGYVCEYVCILA